MHRNKDARPTCVVSLLPLYTKALKVSQTFFCVWYNICRNNNNTVIIITTITIVVYSPK